MAKTKIEWADRVWNPVTGCSKVSPGCANCYAERMSKRFGEKWGLPADDPFRVTLHPERLEQPLRWTKPSKTFVCSMADLFHEDVPFDFFRDIMHIIRVCKEHTFLFLTKRPERMIKMFKILNGAPCEQTAVDEIQSWWSDFLPLPNLWLGVTAENQEQADKRIPILLETPATKRFVSVEPMLSAVDLRSFDVDGGTYYPLDGDLGVEGRGHCPGPKLDWVICGGESGPGARPMHPDWVRNLRDQCKDTGVPFLFKQWGEWGQLEGSGTGAPTPICYWNDESENWVSGLATHTQNMVRIGKKKAGRMIDGQLWKLYPVG